MESEIKELRVFTQYKNRRAYKAWPGQKPKHSKGLGMGVLAQSLQLTPTDLEPSIRIKGERRPESTRNGDFRLNLLPWFLIRHLHQ